jgi:pseudouridine-5'-phosphate glycosidase
VQSASEVADILLHRSRINTGLLLTVPIPVEAELDAAQLDSVLAQALIDCEAAGIRGAAVTPFVLGRIGQATEGRSVPANLALAENNARVAAEVAVAIADY